MKRVAAMAAVLSAMAFLTGIAPAQEDNFFVSLSGNDAWSGKLPAPNPAKTDGPFATVRRARDAVRALKAGGLAKPVNVVLREGTYHLQETLVLGPEDSGDEKRPVTYTAFEGEKAILSGGRPISGWKSDDGKIYYADIPEARDGQWKFRQLFVNDRRQTRARYPNFDPTDIVMKGWLFVPGDGSVILAGIAKQGDWLECPFDAPAKAKYTLWVGYTTIHNDAHEKFTLKVDDRAVTLAPMAATGGWRTVRYVRAAELDLEAGRHLLRVEGCLPTEQRVHFDAFVFTDNAACAPRGYEFPLPAAGENRVVVEAEAKTGGATAIQGGFQTFLRSEHTATKTAIRCPKGSICESWTRAPEAEIHIFASYGWFNQIVRIASVDRENSVIAVEGPECYDKIWAGNRFFVSNVFEELDEPGEWYLDTRAGRLYYWPRADTPDMGRAVVIAPVLDRIFHLRADVEGKERVRHINIRNLHFAHTDYTVGHVEMRTAQDGCVMLECASDCSVENCTFTNIGGYAVWLHLDSCRNTIKANTVAEAGAGGVLLTSARVGWGGLFDSRKAAADFAPVQNTIADNHIHHSGVIRKYVSGVHLDWRPRSMAGSPGNVVARNHIHHMPRLGIMGFTNQGGNTLESNHIHHVMLESDDGGGIHLNTDANFSTATTVIRNNLIHDVQGPKIAHDGTLSRRLGFGVYLDGATSNCEIRDNVICRTSWGTIFINGGNNNLIENNVLVDDAVQQLWIADYRRSPPAMSGNRFRRNIVYFTAPDAKLIMFQRLTSEKTLSALSECDWNLYWAAGQPLVIEPFGPLDEWRKLGFDAHSLAADPLFTDAAADDYSLRTDSPALKLGFAPMEAMKRSPSR